MSRAETTGGSRGAGVPTMRRWLGRSVAAVADQGLFAASNFVLNVLLARWLTIAEYGAFSVVYAAFLLLGTVHSALLSEPLLVFGPGRYAPRLGAYLGTLVRLHWKMSAAFAGVILAAAGVLVAAGESLLAATAAALVPAAPLILLTWLLRRACYPRMQPHWAALGGLAYLLTMLGLLVLLAENGAISPPAAILSIGVASLAALAVLFVHLRVPPLGRRRTPDRNEVTRQHWEYGRWALGTYVLEWVPTNLFILLLPLTAGLEGSGSFRALLNLVVPMIHVSTALGVLAMPVLVKSGRDGVHEHVRLSRRLAVGFAAIGAAYALLLLVAGRPLMALLYDGRYDAFAGMLTPLAAVPILAGLIAVFGSSLRAIERPELVFRSYLPATLIVGGLGAVLTLALGVAGASYGWALTYGAIAAALYLAFARWARRNERGGNA